MANLLVWYHCATSFLKRFDITAPPEHEGVGDMNQRR